MAGQWNDLPGGTQVIEYHSASLVEDPLVGVIERAANRFLTP